MNRTISAEERSALEATLCQLAGRLDGAVDFWTLVFLGDFPGDRRAFFVQRGEEMQALVRQLQDGLARAGLGDVEPLPTHLRELRLACEKLQRAFLTLEQLRVLPLEAVRPATAAVAEVYADLRRVILALGQAVGLAIHYWEGKRAEQEEYFQNILSGLNNLCLHERDSGQTSAIASQTA